MDTGWERVGKRVDAERVRRGHRSLAEFARAVGLGKTTIDKLVHARQSNYDPATLNMVEQALGWQSGSIERIYQGLGPIYDTDPDLTALLDVWPHLSRGSRTMLRHLAERAAEAEGV